MKNKKYYAIIDKDTKKFYAFLLQEDTLRHESWYQVEEHNEFNLDIVFETYEIAEKNLNEILTCKPELNLAIVEIDTKIGKYAK